MASERSAGARLAPALVESVLERLELPRAPEPTLEGLRAFYEAWRHHVPFDNVRKRLHLPTGYTDTTAARDAHGASRNIRPS